VRVRVRVRVRARTARQRRELLGACGDDVRLVDGIAVQQVDERLAHVLYPTLVRLLIIIAVAVAAAAPPTVAIAAALMALVRTKAALVAPPRPSAPRLHAALAA
jgi:hypothetical protein